MANRVLFVVFTEKDDNKAVLDYAIRRPGMIQKAL